MPSDISLAVGDGARRMTYAELAAVRGISLPSARRLVLRHHWPRQAGNDGVVRVIVPLGQVRTVPRTTSPKAPETIGFPGPGPAQAMAHGTDPRAATGGPGTGLGSDSALARAVETHREQLGIANRRIDELQTALAEERRRVIEILVPLSAHRITEELVDNKVLLKGAYSEADQAAVPSIEKRTSDHWSDRVSMTAALFLSLGLCAVLWEAMDWLASALSW